MGKESERRRRKDMGKDEKTVFPGSGSEPAEMADDEVREVETPDWKAMGNEIRALNLKVDQLRLDVEVSLKTEEKMEETVKEQMEQLRLDFEEKVKNDRHKDAIIDKLHEENQDYKRDLLRKVMEPVFLNVIRLIDDYAKLSKHYHGKELTPEDGQKLRKSIEGIGSDLEYLLLNQGVEPYSTGEGYFDPKRHRALETVETTDETKDKALVESLRSGYRWGDRVIRYEMVSVNVYKKPQSDKERRDGNE
jgi:molecular chaperone GrpE (heat shock protein)